MLIPMLFIVLLAAPGGAMAAVTPTVDPTAWDFGNVNEGASSTPTTITVGYTGSSKNYKLENPPFSFTAGTHFFVNSTNCTAGLAIGFGRGTVSSCTIDVVFQPTATGALADTLKINTNKTTDPTVSLSGTGDAAPVVNLSPVSVNFGSQMAGTASAVQAVILTNSGTAPILITSIAATDEFSQTNDCPVDPATLAEGASCTINSQFSPTSEGDKAGSITVIDDAAGSPHSTTLSGTATLTPVTVNLSITKVAEPNPTQCEQDVTYTITVSSTGTAAAENVVVTDVVPTDLTLVSVETSAGSCILNTASCNLGTLEAGTTATITIVATPTEAGTIQNIVTAESDSLTDPVSTTVDLTVNNVNCGGGSEASCTLVQGTLSASSLFPLGAIMVSIATIGIAIRRRTNCNHPM